MRGSTLLFLILGAALAVAGVFVLTLILRSIATVGGAI